MKAHKGHYPSPKELANLRPFNKMSKDEHLRASANGGKKKAENKKCADVLRILVDKVYKDKKGAKADGREVLMVTLFNEAVKKGKVEAFRLILQLLDEMPTQNLNLNVDKDATDNGMLDQLLEANLKIQKQIIEEEKNEQTRTECSNENSELA